MCSEFDNEFECFFLIRGQEKNLKGTFQDNGADGRMRIVISVLLVLEINNM